MNKIHQNRNESPISLNLNHVLEEIVGLVIPKKASMNYLLRKNQIDLSILGSSPTIFRFDLFDTTTINLKEELKHEIIETNY